MILRSLHICVGILRCGTPLFARRGIRHNEVWGGGGIKDVRIPFYSILVLRKRLKKLRFGTY